MKNKLFSAILFLALCSFAAQASTPVTIIEKNGTENKYQIEESGKMYFSGNGLVIETKAGAPAITVNVANIRKVTFPKTSVGLDAKDSESISLFAFPNPVKDVVFLAGVKSGEKVAIYSANGSLVSEISYADEGIDLSSLPSGAYVISVVGKSVKISKL